MPQAPQFLGSVATLVHAPLQSSSPAGQVQPPSLHVPPVPGRRCRSCRSWPDSSSTSLHWPLQSRSPAGQERTQAPPSQKSVLPQTVPQPPQLFGSVAVLVHAQLQTASLGGHSGRLPQALQPPSTQVPPGPQALPQLPQLASLDAGVHALAVAQGRGRLAVGDALRLLADASPAGQALPQAPQLLASSVVSVQAQLQIVSKAGQVIAGQPAQAPPSQV